MVDQGFMSGYDRNYFGPNDTITRAQVAKVATLVGGIHTPEVEGTDSPAFADVPVRRDSNGKVIAYPFDFVQEAAAAGLVSGSAGADGQALFNPNGTITRVQLAQILARMLKQLKGYPGAEAPAPPSDQPGPVVPQAAEPAFGDVPAYAAADVTLVVSLGLMSGTSETAFGASTGAKRGQVATAMSRYLDLPVQPPAAPQAG
jgi:hypothetical protein